MLRRLAAVFDIPPELFGLADIDGPAFHQSGPPLDSARDEATRREGGVDPVRRREVIGGLAGLVGSALAGLATPPRVVASLEDVLLGGCPTPAGTVDPARLRTALASVWSDFRACRYAGTADSGRLIAGICGPWPWTHHLTEDIDPNPSQGLSDLGGADRA